MTELLERMSRYVEENPGAGAGQVAAALGVDRGAVEADLRRLERAGFLERFLVRREARYRSFKPYRPGGHTAE
jgi:DNA-binding MarR family transcriptional regulator